MFDGVFCFVKECFVLFKQLFNRKNPIVEQIEKEAEINEHIMNYNIGLRKEDDALLLSIEQKKEVFNKEFLPIYKEKLNSLTDEELKEIAQKCLRSSILYLRQLGGFLNKEEFYMRQRVYGKMVDDLTDAIHNLPHELFDQPTESKIVFELLFVLQFFHAYDELQFQYLRVSFHSLQSSFPTNFVIKMKEREKVTA